MKQPIFLYHSLICFCFLFLPAFLPAQELMDDGEVYQVNFSGSPEDFTIPADTDYDQIEFYLDGGDGGRHSNCQIKGGKGAQIRVVFNISSSGTNALRPGGTIRFIVGERGKNRTGETARGGAGGGGGTAILYQKPGATITDEFPSTSMSDADTDWVILAVAGGGGGAYGNQQNSLDNCVGSRSRKGQGARTGTNGGGTGSNYNPGGTGGNGGTSSGEGGAGGGYLSSGHNRQGVNNTHDGRVGRIFGGSGGHFTNNNMTVTEGRGGWGYGGGGAGQKTNDGGGGGGGGYSGGAGGVGETTGWKEGRGGGSFVNVADVDEFTQKQGDQHVSNPKDGYITYVFRSSNGIIAKCKDVTLQLGSSGQATLFPEDANNGSYTTDGSTIENYILTTNEGGFGAFFNFNCSDVGDYEYNLAVFNDVTFELCSFNVTVEDNVAPVAHCKDVTVQIDVANTVLIPTNSIDNGSSDACTSFVISLDQTQFNCSQVGDQTVELTIWDENENTGTCTATVTVEDISIPQLSCIPLPLILPLENGSMQSITANQLISSAVDNCSTASRSLSQSNFDCSDIGINNILVTVTDPSGNSNTCMAIVVIEDDSAPPAICQDATITLDNQGTASLSANSVDDGSSQDCGPVSLSVSPDNFECSHIGVQEVTLTVTNENDNQATCTAMITINDEIPPTVACLDVTLSLDDQGNANLTEGQINDGSNDNCDIEAAALSKSNFDCTDLGENTVTLSATDASGNSTTCSAIVTVEAAATPTALCQDATLALDDQGNGNLSASDVDGGSRHNCDQVSLSVSPANFDCSHLGNQEVTLTVTDEGNNQSTCTASVTVVDDIPPVALCRDRTIQLNEAGFAMRSRGAFNDGSYDNCGSVKILNNFLPIIFGCNNVGTRLITLKVKKGNLTSSCTATATIVDNHDPTLICESATVQLDANGLATLLADQIITSEEDNCGIQSQSLSQSSFDCSNIGDNSVTLTSTDASGNTGTCSVTLTVEDQIPPTLSCQNNLILTTDQGQCETTYSLPLPSAADNCEVTVLRYRHREVDSDGNNIAGIDWTSWSTDPSITLGVGHWKIQWQAKDAANNQNKCSFLIEVQDNEAPKPICLNSTVTFNGEPDLSLPIDQLWDENASSDNCGQIIYTNASSPFVTCDQIGSIVPITLFFQDAAGNNANCTANVTVDGLLCNWESDHINCSQNAQAGYDPATGTFDLSAQGCYDPNYYSNSDAQGMIWQGFCGDGEIIAHINGIDGNAWAGISMRESNDPGAKMLQLAVNNAGLAQRKLRTTTGGYAFNHLFQNMGKYWLKLTRSGNQFSAFLSSDGNSWDLVFLTNIPMPNCIKVGLITMNEYPNSPATATFSQVSVNGSNGLGLQAVATTSDQILQDPSLDFGLYPNPSSGEINIDFGQLIGMEVEMEIYNKLGQIVFSKKIDRIEFSTERLDLYQLPGGTYLIKIKTMNEQATKKFILGKL